jgi:glycosyltransferase involved in cell wall biosynthesis
MSLSNPLVSVIMPNFNNEKYLAQAIESVLQQTLKSFELIVVDDGSTDGSLGILESYGDSIQYFSTKNRGAAAARNLGILNSKGSIIAFLDSDDLWLLGKLSKQVTKLLAEDLDLVYCHVQEIDARNSPGIIKFARFKGDCHKDFMENPSVAVIVAGMSTAIIRRELLAVSGIFDTRVPAPTEDWDFLRRFCKHARVDYCDEVLTQYRIHANNISRSSFRRYFSGNLFSIHKMFIEEKIGFFKRFHLHSKLYVGFAKHYLKSHFHHFSKLTKDGPTYGL